MNKTLFAAAVASLAVAMTTGCVSTPSAYRVENQKIVLDSPFALEIGSTEYAKAFGDLIQTSAHANYDPQTKKTTTNFYHHAECMSLRIRRTSSSARNRRHQANENEFRIAVTQGPLIGERNRSIYA